MKHGFFNKTVFFHKQKSGLQMCSPLSVVFACLFLQFLKSGSFKDSISLIQMIYIYPQNNEKNY